jgi:hypothetical protein
LLAQFSLYWIQTVGYDPKKTYIGIWVDAMMNHLGQHEGWDDAQGATLTP